MSEQIEDLPREILETAMSFFREKDGELELADKEGLAKFVAEHGERHPALLGLFTINHAAAADHFKTTGAMPPGIEKLIGITRGEGGDNVIGLEILRAPTDPKPSDNGKK